MPRMNRITKNNTQFWGDSAAGGVVLHRTKIIEWTPDRITLDHGGWMTVTTKTRINQAADQFGLPVRVHQVDGEWYVNDRPWSGRTFVVDRATRSTEA